MKVREAIAIAAHVASKSATLPILSTLRVSGRHIYATDLTQQVEIPVELPEGIAGADFCVNAARLMRVLKALPEELELKLEVPKKKQRLLVSAGPTHYELNTLPAADFPMLDEDASAATVDCTLDSKPLVAALTFVQRAMAVQDVRYYLCGVHFTTAPGRITLTATDGHRMHRARVPLAEQPDLAFAEGIIAGPAVARIIEIAARHTDIEIALTPTRLVVNSNESLATKLVDGKFPDADKVIPHDRPVTGSVPRTALAAALKRVTQIFNGTDGGVRMDFTPEAIELAATNAEGEKAAERFEWTAADKTFTGCSTGFASLYVIDALEAFSTDFVNLHLPADNTASLYITDSADGEWCAVVMPMRL